MCGVLSHSDVFSTASHRLKFSEGGQLAWSLYSIILQLLYSTISTIPIYVYRAVHWAVFTYISHITG